MGRTDQAGVFVAAAPEMMVPDTVPCTLAVCAEMVFRDLPMAERVKRIAALGFKVEIWDWTKHDIDALKATGAAFSSMTGYVTGALADDEGADWTRAMDPVQDFFIARYFEAYLAEIDHFLDCVEKGTRPLAGFSEGREALRLADAALESLHAGRTVRLEG